MDKHKLRVATLLIALFLFTFWIGENAREVRSQQLVNHTAFLPTINSKVGWITECVACIPSINSLGSPSAVLDRDGVMHVAYAGDKLYYARKAGGGDWEKVVVDDTFNLTSATIALGADGRPHIIYRHRFQIRYAYFDGSQWQTELVDNISYGTGPISLVIDSINNPHVSYVLIHSEYSGEVVYAYRNNGSWEKDILDPSSGRERTSLTLDSEDQPHIVFGGDFIRYGTKSTEGWHFEDIDGGQDPTIILDDSDLPHIASGGEAGLQYSYKTDLGWKYELIDAGDEESYFGSGVRLPDIQLDSQGEPQIGYLVWTYGPTPYATSPYYFLRYAHFDVGQWLIDDVTDFVTYNPITMLLDPLDQPMLVFTITDLIMASGNQDSSWLMDTIDTSSSIERFSLAVDTLNNPHLSFVESSRSGTYYKYGKLTDGSWNFTDIKKYGGKLDPESDISVADDGTVHVALIAGSCTRFGCQYHLIHTYWDGQTWKSSYASDTLRDSIEIGYVATDSRNRPHLAHGNTYAVGEYSQVEGDFNWSTAVLEGFEEVGAIAIDSSDFPAIVGYTKPKWAGGEVLLARLSETGWLVTLEEELESFESVAFTPDDQILFLRFFGAPIWAFGYSYRDDLGWHQVSVEEEATGTCQKGIAVDENYGIHMAYKQANGLVYTYISQSGERSSTVLATNVTSCAFGLSADGRAFIAYGFENDLKIVYQKPD